MLSNLLWKNAVYDTPGEKLVHLFDKNCNDTSALTRPTHNSLSRRGYVLEIMIRQNVRLSDITVYQSLNQICYPLFFTYCIVLQLDIIRAV